MNDAPFPGRISPFRQDETDKHATLAQSQRASTTLPFRRPRPPVGHGKRHITEHTARARLVKQRPPPIVALQRHSPLELARLPTPPSPPPPGAYCLQPPSATGVKPVNATTAISSPIFPRHTATAPLTALLLSRAGPKAAPSLGAVHGANTGTIPSPAPPPSRPLSMRNLVGLNSPPYMVCGVTLTPSRTCRETPRQPSTFSPTTISVPLIAASEFYPPWCHASPVRDGPRDHARRVLRFTVDALVKTYSDLSHRRLVAGRATPGSSVNSRALERAWRSAHRALVGRPSSWPGRVAKVELGHWARFGPCAKWN
jgi:hypothetical protein